MKASLTTFLAFIILTLTYETSLCAEVDESHYFVHPDAQFVVESGRDRWVQKLSEAPVRPQDRHKRPDFSNSMDFYGKMRVGYQFAGMTKFGDVYVIFIDEYGKTRELIPVIFEGKDKTVVERKDLKIYMKRITK